MTDFILLEQQKQTASCKTCLRLRIEVRYCDKSKRAAVTKAMMDHKQFVRAVRSGYQQRRHFAKTNSTTHASVIIDGMDQAKTCLPYSALEFAARTDIAEGRQVLPNQTTRTKITFPQHVHVHLCVRLVQRVHGCLSHGRGKFIFLVNPTVRKHSGQVVTLLAEVLSQLPDSVRHLSVQVDGSSGKSLL